MAVESRFYSCPIRVTCLSTRLFPARLFPARLFVVVLTGAIIITIIVLILIVTILIVRILLLVLVLVLVLVLLPLNEPLPRLVHRLLSLLSVLLGRRGAPNPEKAPPGPHLSDEDPKRNGCVRQMGNTGVR